MFLKMDCRRFCTVTLVIRYFCAHLHWTHDTQGTDHKNKGCVTLTDWTLNRDSYRQLHKM